MTIFVTPLEPYLSPTVFEFELQHFDTSSDMSTTSSPATASESEIAANLARVVQLREQVSFHIDELIAHRTLAIKSKQENGDKGPSPHLLITLHNDIGAILRALVSRFCFVSTPLSVLMTRRTSRRLSFRLS